MKHVKPYQRLEVTFSRFSLTCTRHGKLDPFRASPLRPPRCRQAQARRLSLCLLASRPLRAAAAKLADQRLHTGLQEVKHLPQVLEKRTYKT